MYSLLNRITLSLSCCKPFYSNRFILRRISFLDKIKAKPILLDKKNHSVIYEFKYVVFTAGILKTKKILPIVCIPLVSTCIFLNQLDWVALILVGYAFQFIVLTGFSRLAENVVGKIYVNREGAVNNVIISSIDSAGNRIDESFSPDQLYLSEFDLSRYLGFIKVETKNGNKIFKMNIKNPIVHDAKALNSIFNEISHYINVKEIKKSK